MNTILKTKIIGYLSCGTLRVKILCLAILLFLSLLPNLLYAQKNIIQFERISVEQGLSQSGVHCIMQDSKGFMWFGTWDGLNKYDGYNFTVIKNDSEYPHSLSNNSIRAIYEDREGIFWIGTDGGGLNRFDSRFKREGKKYFVRYQNNPDDPHSLSHDKVNSVFEDHEGIIWIGTEGGGLNKLDREKEQFIRYRHNPDDPHTLSHDKVNSVYEDHKGVLWIGTEGGLSRFDREKEQFIRYQNDPDNPHSLGHNNISVLCEDHEGVLWIGTEGGLSRFDREKEQFTRYQNDSDNPHSLSHNNVRTIYEDQWNVLWIGTEGGGLNKFDRKKEQFVRYQNDPNNPRSLSHDVVWSVYGDRSGMLWIGTYTGGLNKFDRGKEQFVHYKNDPNNPDSLSHNNVWSLYEDRDRILWIGTDTGLNRFDRERGEFILYQHDPDNPRTLSHNEVWLVYEDRSGIFWAGTYSGLNKFDRNSGHVTRYMNPFNKASNKIRAVREDLSDMLWVGTGDGLYQFDREKEAFIRYQNDPDNPHSLSHNSVWTIYEDMSGVLWIGTEDGLCQFDREKKQFVRYQNNPDDPNSLSNNWCLSVCEDQRGDLWIGTVNGLNQYDRSKETFTRYREKDGLPNDVIYGILEDRRGHLWLSTNKGLSKFDPQKGVFKNYDATDGLQSNEFNVGAYHSNGEGELFFGGIKGFNAFYPSEKDNPYLPSIVITDFRIFNEPVEVGENSLLRKPVEDTDEIRLSYRERVFSFEFVALHFASPEKNQYAYMVEGFDKDWIYSGTRRFATYTNLPAGKYVFRAKGSNSDGLWNEEGASIILITITPPPWKTWWAYTLYASLLGGAVFGYVRYKTKAQAEEIERHRKELEQKRLLAELLEKKVEERTRELNKTLEDVRSANMKITDSLHYAELIQRSLLPNPDEVKICLPESFFIWMPRDIVGGDIFFVDFFDNGFIIAVIDCTGHGVPGAFMTMIASSGLKRIIKDEGCYNPGEILKRLNFIVKTSLQQDTAYALSDDGLDAAICVVRLKESYLTSFDLIFAGARMPLYYTLNNEITTIRGDKKSLGYKKSDLDFDFTNHTVTVEKGMRFYMATDGLQDQLGKDETSRFGARCFGKKRFKELLRKNSYLPFEEQQEAILRAFDEYKGENERQDDVTLVGFGFIGFPPGTDPSVSSLKDCQSASLPLLPICPVHSPKSLR